MKRLSAKQERFIEEFVRCWNGTKAAEYAGYNPDSARKIASELRNHPKYRHVQIALAKKINEGKEKREIEYAAQTEALMQAIRFDPSQTRHPVTGEWLSLHELDPDVARQIVSVQENEYQNDGQSGRSVSMKFANKLEAVKILGKHNGYFAAGTSAGEHTAYRDARENLSRMFDRVKRRAEGPAPGTPDAGGGG